MWHPYIKEQTQLNRVCYFRFFDVFLASGELSFETCISSLQLVFCQVVAVKILAVNHHSANNLFSGPLVSLV